MNLIGVCLRTQLILVSCHILETRTGYGNPSINLLIYTRIDLDCIEVYF